MTRIFQVDSFTDKAFAGNPAGVCILEHAAKATWMQQIALEMNLSETAFLWPEEAGYRLRWFTPLVEVDLCGHATLASAHVLWEQGTRSADHELRFFTHSGELCAQKRDGMIWLDFPSLPLQPIEPASVPAAIVSGLGLHPRFVGKSRFDYLVELDSEDQLRGLCPDSSQLGQVDCRGIIVTARAARYDFVSRFFAPATGIAEDPVTGSAHCVLGPYWAEKLKRTSLRAFQASRRGGEVSVTVSGDRTQLGGSAITTLIGEIVV